MKIRATSLFLAALLSLLCTLCACESRQESVIVTDKAPELFTAAMKRFSEEAFVSFCDISLSGSIGGKEFKIVQHIDSLYRNDLEPSLCRARSFLYPASEPDNKTELYESVRVGNDCYYTYDGSRIKTDFTSDYSSQLGLYSLGRQSPQSIYAISGNGETRIDFTFDRNACAFSQETLVVSLLRNLGVSSENCAFSSLSVSSILDDGTGAFKSLNLSFTVTHNGEEESVIRFSYTESFSSYGTTEEIDLPDPSLYTKL